MKTQYILWCIFVEKRVSPDDSIDFSNCPSNGCPSCDKTSSCDILPQLMTPAWIYTLEYENYSQVKQDIAKLMEDSNIFTVFVLNKDTHIGYLYKGNHDIQKFSSEVVPTFFEEYFNREQLTLTIDSLEDIRGISNTVN